MGLADRPSSTLAEWLSKEAGYSTADAEARAGHSRLVRPQALQPWPSADGGLPPPHLAQVVAHKVWVLGEVDRLQRQPPQPLAPVDGLRTVAWSKCSAL